MQQDAGSLPIPPAAIRLYYYTTKAWGQKILWERRLKIARYQELNDAFEILPFDASNRRTRAYWRRQVAKVLHGSHGIVCLSATWRNPQMWAHYADKQSGMCLGFDVMREFAAPIRYVDRPLAEPTLDRGSRELPVAVIEAALRHKHSEWRYEEEWRIRAPLANGEDGLYYLPFDRGIELREVILGPRCSLSSADVVHAVASPPLDVEIFSTRPAHDAFRIERHELLTTHNVRGFRSVLSAAPDATWSLGDGH